MLTKRNLVFARFHQPCLNQIDYKKKLRLSKQIIGYNIDYFFGIFEDTLKPLSNDIEETFAKIITQNIFFSVVKIRLKKIAYKLLHFKNFNHLFYCHRGSKSVGKCKYCGRFYVEESDPSYYIKKCLAVCKSALFSTSVGILAAQVRFKTFTLSLC